MKKVLIPTKLDPVSLRILAEHGNYMVVQDAQKPFADLIAEHSDAHALIVRSEPVTEDVLDALPKLRVVVRAGAGFNTIDIKHARLRGVDVMNTPGANANAVAEEVVALMLADARHLLAADASTRRGDWEKSKFMGRELAGKTLGIVGLGNIGRLVAKRVSGFECRLLGYDPLVPSDTGKSLGIEMVSLETLFKESDFVTLHIPETPETRGLVGERLLRLMKEGATVVNCARAGIIDEGAMRAIKPQKKLRFLNDVYPKDAAGPKSVADIADLMVPHLGANTYEANENAARRAATQLIDYDDKGITSYVVNRDVPDGLDQAYCTLAYTLAALARGLVGRETPLSRVETSFYSELGKYGKWLLRSILNGIWGDVDRATDVEESLAHLRDSGIVYVDRVVESSKQYGNSMTLDLLGLAGGREAQRVSVRGTIAEGVCMVSRVNQFDRLYWVPHGAALFFQYKDRPGVIAKITRRLAELDVNIEDMRNPHDAASDESLALISVLKPVEPYVVENIGREIDATMAQCVMLCPVIRRKSQ
jgi:D-3-phosphoglycerate dehydrogenase